MSWSQVSISLSFYGAQYACSLKKVMITLCFRTSKVLLRIYLYFKPFIEKIFDLCVPAVPVDWSICIDQGEHKQWIDWKGIWLWVFHRKMMFVHSDWAIATTQNNEALFLILKVYSNAKYGKYSSYRG